MFCSLLNSLHIIHVEKGSKQPAKIVAEWNRRQRQQIPVVVAVLKDEVLSVTHSIYSDEDSLLVTQARSSPSLLF